MSELNLPQEVEEGPPSGAEQNLPQEAQQARAAGPPGPDDITAAGGCACTLFAVVDRNGALVRGYRAVSATRLSVGTYEVVFDRNIRRCAYVGTIGLPGSTGFSPSGEIMVAGRRGNDNGVYVQTNSSAGTALDLGFHLAVHCSP